MKDRGRNNDFAQLIYFVSRNNVAKHSKFQRVTRKTCMQQQIYFMNLPQVQF